MKKLIQGILLFMFLSLVSFSETDISMYPKAEKNWKKHIFILAEKEKEEDFQIELKFGKDVLVDCNQYFFLGGEIHEKTVEGWGYPYYEFSAGKSEMVGTLMGCPSEEKTKKRVYYSQGDKMLPYNSKLPLVIYTPEDIKVELYLWNKIEKISSR